MRTSSCRLRAALVVAGSLVPRDGARASRPMDHGSHSAPLRSATEYADRTIPLPEDAASAAPAGSAGNTGRGGHAAWRRPGNRKPGPGPGAPSAGPGRPRPRPGGAPGMPPAAGPGPGRWGTRTRSAGRKQTGGPPKPGRSPGHAACRRTGSGRAEIDSPGAGPPETGRPDTGRPAASDTAGAGGVRAALADAERPKLPERAGRRHRGLPAVSTDRAVRTAWLVATTRWTQGLFISAFYMPGPDKAWINVFSRSRAGRIFVPYQKTSQPRFSDLIVLPLQGAPSIGLIRASHAADAGRRQLLAAASGRARAD